MRQMPAKPFVVQQPSTQDCNVCDGTMESELTGDNNRSYRMKTRFNSNCKPGLLGTKPTCPLTQQTGARLQRPMARPCELTLSLAQHPSGMGYGYPTMTTTTKAPRLRHSSRNTWRSESAGSAQKVRPSISSRVEGVSLAKTPSETSL